MKHRELRRAIMRSRDAIPSGRATGAIMDCSEMQSRATRLRGAKRFSQTSAYGMEAPDMPLLADCAKEI